MNAHKKKYICNSLWQLFLKRIFPCNIVKVLGNSNSSDSVQVNSENMKKKKNRARKTRIVDAARENPPRDHGSHRAFARLVCFFSPNFTFANNDNSDDAVQDLSS